MIASQASCGLHVDVRTGTATRAGTLSGTLNGSDGAAFMRVFLPAQNKQAHMISGELSDARGHYRVEKVAHAEGSDLTKR